eukprot:GEMP01048437.1.p1 GENE.GEMP01048437.1~~GEMP01048437.1.p1  ORF type:complete len:216 (+),score=59.37 GEMP01048437.1:120-767(+)
MTGSFLSSHRDLGVASRDGWKNRYGAMIDKAESALDQISSQSAENEELGRRSKRTVAAATYAWDKEISDVTSKWAREKARRTADLEKKRITVLEMRDRTTKVEKQNARLMQEIDRVRAETLRVLRIEPPTNTVSRARRETDEIQWQKGVIRKMEEQVIELEREVGNYKVEISALHEEDKTRETICKALLAKVMQSEEKLLKIPHAASIFENDLLR